MDCEIELEFDYEAFDETNQETNAENGEIILSENQEECTVYLMHAMEEYGVVLNSSYMGRGKSMMVIETIKRFDLRIGEKILICPAIGVAQWEKYDQRYNVGFTRILSYDSLRGTMTSKNKNNKILLKHGLLYRTNDEFEITPTFMEMLPRGVWLFFDECRKMAKKDRIQQKAAKAAQTLCRAVMDYRREYGTFCGVYMFSATPFFRQEDCANFFYTTGLLTKPLFPDSGIENSGLIELRDFCYNKIDREKTNRIWSLSEFRQKKADLIAYNLCVEVLLPAISKFCKPEKNTSAIQTIFITYEKISNIGMQILRASEEMIHKSNSSSLNITDEMENKYAQIVGCDPRDRVLSTRSKVTQAQITAQVIKTYYIIIPLAQKVLDEIPNSKVTIFLQYKEAIRVAKRFLEEYGVVVLMGKDSDRKGNKRQEYIDAFQKPDLEYRVLISISQIGSEFHDFDDKHGNFPRIGFTPLFYCTGDVIQSSGRICRKTTKSSSLFYVCKVDTENETIEKSLENITKQKSEILKKTLRDNGVIPPTNFYTLKDMRNKSFREYLDKAGSFEYSQDLTEEKENVKITIKKSSIVFDI